ncbi:MAG: DinB family protein [Gemmatimonadota bacterium]|nr:DinB family protein [Gemmatimonadota bacterium]
MSRNAEALAVLARGVGADTARTRPGPGKWNLREIYAHLHDEEREDFRVRLDYTLHRPGREWPGIDPEGWVTERKYAERPLEESVEGFLRERRESLRWLESLSNVDWDATYEHPRGPLRAGDLMAAWVAHDVLHLRQIAYTVHALLGQNVSPYTTRYAGDWPDRA